MQRLLEPEEVEQYRTISQNYHPGGQIVYNFARSKFGVIAGPTGAGKDTLRNALVKNQSFQKILSTTTRPPREGEQDGVEYHFRDLQFFDKAIDEKRFLQLALVHNQQLSALDFAELEKLSTGQFGIAILVVQTEIGLRKLNPDMKTIFIVPPGLATLKARIENERIMDHEEVNRRMSGAKEELEIALKQPNYYCIVNDEIPRVVDLAGKFFRLGEKNADEDKEARAVINLMLKELS